MADERSGWNHSHEGASTLRSARWPRPCPARPGRRPASVHFIVALLTSFTLLAPLPALRSRGHPLDLTTGSDDTKSQTKAVPRRAAAERPRERADYAPGDRRRGRTHLPDAAVIDAAAATSPGRSSATRPERPGPTRTVAVRRGVGSRPRRRRTLTSSTTATRRRRSWPLLSSPPCLAPLRRPLTGVALAASHRATAAGDICRRHPAVDVDGVGAAVDEWHFARRWLTSRTGVGSLEAGVMEYTCDGRSLPAEIADESR